MGKELIYRNILIVSLDSKFCKDVARELANELDMFYADCKELIVYDLINPKEILEKCGFEYLKKREKSVIKNCAEYENTVISINFNLYKEYYKLFASTIIFYLELPKLKLKETTNKIAYQSRDEFLSKFCNVKLSFERKSKLNATNQIIEKLGELV